MTLKEEIEQLESQLETVSDPYQKADIILEILRKHNHLKSQNAKEYIDRLVIIAETIEIKKRLFYLAWATLHSGIIERFKGNNDKALEIFELSLKQFSEIDNKEGIANTCNNMGIALFEKGKCNEAINTHTQALNLRVEAGDNLGTASSHNNLGTVYNAKGNYLKALWHHDIALKIRVAANDLLGVAASYNNRGHVFYNQGNFTEALKNHNLALEISGETGNHYTIANCLTNIGNVYAVMGNLKESLLSYKKALEFQSETEDTFGISISFSNIGCTYYDLGEIPEAVRYFSMALELREFKDEAGMIVDYNCLGRAYFSNQDYKGALKSHFAALELAEKRNIKPEIAHSHHHIGAVYLKLGKTSDALECFRSALQIAKKIGARELVKDISLSIANTFEFSGEYKKALQFHKQYNKLQNALLGATSRKQMINLGWQRKLHEVEKLEKEKVSAKLAIKQLQMNPHDTADFLDYAILAIRDKNIDGAKEILRLFKDLNLLKLEYSKRGSITVADEFAIINIFLRLIEAHKYKNLKSQVSFTSTGTRMESNTFLPPNILYPFVDNAVRYGIANMKNRRNSEPRIYVTLEERDNVLTVEISDNGKGFQPSPSYVYKRLGIKNTKDRIEAQNSRLGKLSTDFNISYREPGEINKGTVVSFKIYLSNSVKYEKI